jgi:hypothetical protein
LKSSTFFFKQGKRLAIFINKEVVKSLAGLLTGYRQKTGTITLNDSHGTRPMRGHTESPWLPTEATHTTKARII